MVKLYINGDFVQSSSLDDPNLVATRLEIDKLNNEHRIFAIKNLGSSGSSENPPVENPPVNVSPEVEATIKEATIQACQANPASCGITVDGGSCTTTQNASYDPNAGELYIPAVDVPDAFGGIITYEVYLNQQPSSFTFDLDFNRVTPR
ncbi:hypothetical protein BGP_1251 [Beggiatoa sp. PS]|nr:hypothetical protein BGP_1251 [Beggiatoa sp. PS]